MAQTLEPFFVGGGRAMVSLGPLNSRAYCTYRCQFCYVNGPFPRYASRTPEEIVQWLRSRASDYNIVYVSGDTDSFAPPRTSEALDLLESLLALGVDVLFTTRYVLSSGERARFESVARSYLDKGLLLIPCISISQLHHPKMEPRPIPSPDRRFEQLKWMHSLGLPTVLTVRPFIPVIPASEYVEIIERGSSDCNIVLGSDLYLDKSGTLVGMISAATAPLDRVFGAEMTLDFSMSNDPWQIARHPAAQDAAERFCMSRGIPFYMRSAPAVEFLRSRLD